MASVKIPREMLERMTFESFNPAGNPNASRDEREELAEALDVAQRFASCPTGWLLFTGSRGCGKTHLAVAVANEVLREGVQAFFAFVPALLDHLRRTYSPDSTVAFDELFELVLNAPLLILDDLGAENSTPWAEEKLYQIVVHRWELGLHTVITSASGMRDLEERRPAIFSRLVDAKVVAWVAIGAPNYRDQR